MTMTMKVIINHILTVVIIVMMACFCSCKTSQQVVVENKDIIVPAPAPVPAPYTEPTFKELLTQVLDLMSARQWAEAQPKLALMKKVSTTVAERNLFLYTSGYFYQTRFKPGDDPNHYYDTAVSYYLRYISLDPLNKAVIQNLALLHEKAGRQEEAVRFLTASTSTRQRYFEVISADILARQGKSQEAYARYRNIIRRAPYDRMAHEHLVALYDREGMTVPNDSILSHCFEMSQLGFSPLTLRCLAELIVRTKDSEVNREVARAALVWWTSLSATRNNAFDFSVLKSAVDWGEVKVLTSLVQGDSNTDLTEFWRGGKAPLPLRRQLAGIDLAGNFAPRNVAALAMAVAARDLGRQERHAEEEQMLKNAYELVTGGPNNIHMFLMRVYEIPDVFFRVAGDLGILYTHFPKLDEDSTKFRNIERQLFEGKNGSYNEVDTKSIMKFHTTLGLIYAERKQWSGGHYQNGVFQLNSAISKSPDARNTSQLNMLLAEGLEKSNRVREAAESYDRAVVQYLNVDDFAGAAKALEMRNKLEVSKSGRIYTTARKVLAFRESVDRADVSDSALLDFRTTTQSILDLVNVPEIPEHFKHIQAFKMLSDVATLARIRDMKRSSNYYYAAALTEIFKTSAFNSQSDLEKFNRAKNALKDVVVFEPAIRDALPFTGAVKENAFSHVWMFYQPGTSIEQSVSQNKQVTGVAALSMAILAGTEIKEPVISFSGFNVRVLRPLPPELIESLRRITMENNLVFSQL